MVNTFGKPVPKVIQTTQVQPPTLSDPVSVSAELVYGKDKNMAEVILHADILKGWHIYAFLPKDSPFIQTETILELPEGAVAKNEWETSAASPFPGSNGTFVFEGKTTFKVALNLSAVKPGAVIKCGIFYQTCDENKCLQPTRKLVDLTL